MHTRIDQMGVVFGAVLALAVIACAPSATVSDSDTNQTPDIADQVDESLIGLISAQVVNVVDGDTIDVLVDGDEYRVRYIGIDTPETVHPTRGEEPYGREASEMNKRLVLGQTIYLEKDVSETDRYGRLLRYVWLEVGTMVNAYLVAEGYAQVATYPPDVKYTDDFLFLQEEARTQGKGLWGLEAEGSGSPTQVRGCDPAYPDGCIPSPHAL